MKVELVAKTIGVNRYEGLTLDEIIEAVARHGKIKESGLITYLIDHTHWSPMEHTHFTYLIETSREFSAQIFRHKSGHFQEYSLRYSKSKGIQPIEFRLQHESNRQSSTVPIGTVNSDYTITETPTATWEQKCAIENAKRALQDIDTAYKELLDLGIARETARRILPLATTTILHYTANFRDLLAFLNVRCDPHAQKEIVAIATAIGEELEIHHPSMKALDWRNGMFMFSK